MLNTSPDLLRRLRDGTATHEDFLRARAEVEGDVALPHELREVLFGNEDEAAEDAAALLAVYGEPLLHFADALHFEAGDVDVAVAVTEKLGFATLPIARAVTFEAGEVDVADSVANLLGLGGTVAVSAAVRAEAGTVDVSSAVMAALGVAQSAPTAVGIPEQLPAPANNNRGWGFARGVLGAVAVAAVALMALVVGRPDATVEAVPGLLFAQAGDLVVEDLSYSDGVSVVQLEGAGGAVILWVDDGEVGT